MLSNHNMYNREAGEQQKVILMQHKSRLFGSQLCGVIRQQFQYGNEKKKIVKCEKCAGTILTYIDNTTIIGYTSLWILRSHFQVHKGGSLFTSCILFPFLHLFLVIIQNSYMWMYSNFVTEDVFKQRDGQPGKQTETNTQAGPQPQKQLVNRSSWLIWSILLNFYRISDCSALSLWFFSPPLALYCRFLNNNINAHIF